ILRNQLRAHPVAARDLGPLGRARHDDRLGDPAVPVLQATRLALRLAGPHAGPRDWPARVCRSGRACAAFWISAGKSSISWTWRISMISLSEPGQRLAHSMASARELTRIIQ